MTKIFITRKLPDICINTLTEKGYEVKVSDKDSALTKEELIQSLQSESFDGLITLLNDKVDKEVLDICKEKEIKVIANFAVGLNNIDTVYAESLGIKVLNAKGTSGTAVSQHVVALILACADRIVEGQKEIEKNNWQGWNPDYLMGKDVFGKTVGLVGCGNIGAKVADILFHGFNCRIIYTDLNPNHALEDICHAEKVDIDTLLKNADVVSLHVPLLPETTHLINIEKLQLMKPNAILINTARGPVINEADLTKFLSENKSFYAGLDVFEFEPKISEELKSLPNVVLSPHIASAKESARIEMAIATAKNIIDSIG